MNLIDYVLRTVHAQYYDLMKPSIPGVVTSSRTTTSSFSINKNHGYTETGFDMRNLAIVTQKIFEKK